MSLFFGLMQILGWIGVGYFLHSNNWWALVASVMFTALSGLMNAMDAVGKAMQNGTTSKSK